MQVIAGNIATYEAAVSFHRRRRRGEKVGIGPIDLHDPYVAGVGVPQPSAIFDCAKPAGIDSQYRGRRYPIPGDVAKAPAAGASTVMIAHLCRSGRVAGETTSIWTHLKPTMGDGRCKRAAAIGTISPNQLGETRSRRRRRMLPFKGRVSDIVYQLCGGLRSGMGYCGAATIGQLQQNARFIRITPAGMKESHPHDISITKESPNYRFQI